MVNYSALRNHKGISQTIDSYRNASAAISHADYSLCFTIEAVFGASPDLPFFATGVLFEPIQVNHVIDGYKLGGFDYVLVFQLPHVSLG